MQTKTTQLTIIAFFRGQHPELSKGWELLPLEFSFIIPNT